MMKNERESYHICYHHYSHICYLVTICITNAYTLAFAVLSTIAIAIYTWWFYKNDLYIKDEGMALSCITRYMIKHGYNCIYTSDEINRIVKIKLDDRFYNISCHGYYFETRELIISVCYPKKLSKDFNPENLINTSAHH